MMKINFIPEELKHIFPFRLILLGILLVVVTAILFQGISMQKELLADLKIEIKKLKEQQAEIGLDQFVESENIINRIKQLQKAIIQLAAAQKPSWQDLFTLSVLAEAGAELNLHKVLVDADNAILVELSTTNLGIGADYLEKIRLQDRFEDVKLLQGDKKGQGEIYHLAFFVLLEEMGNK